MAPSSTSTEGCCSSASAPRFRARGPRRRGPRVAPSLLRATRSLRRPGPSGLCARVPPRRRAHGGPHRGDRGVSRTGGRRLARGLPAGQSVAVLRTRRHRVRLPRLRSPRLPERHRGSRRNAGVRPHPGRRASRGGAHDGPAARAAGREPGSRPGTGHPHRRPGPPHSGPWNLASRQRPGSPVESAQHPRPGPPGPPPRGDEPPHRHHTVARASAQVLAPGKPVRIETRAGSGRTPKDGELTVPLRRPGRGPILPPSDRPPGRARRD